MIGHQHGKSDVVRELNEAKSRAEEAVACAEAATQRQKTLEADIAAGRRAGKRKGPSDARFLASTVEELAKKTLLASQKQEEAARSAAEVRKLTDCVRRRWKPSLLRCPEILTGPSDN